MADKVEKVVEYIRGYKDGLESVMKEECEDVINQLCESITEAVKNVIPYVMQCIEIKADLDCARWIPVEDALPEIKEYHISDTVLCYCDSGALVIARLEENGFGQVGFNCEKDYEYHHSAGKVLYWMPLPQAPEPPEKE